MATFRFPGLGRCERCGSINDPFTRCQDRSGFTRELRLDFVSNREGQHSGMEVLVNCVDERFDRNRFIGKRQIQQETCMNLDGSPPRNAPQIPPPVS